MKKFLCLSGLCLFCLFFVRVTDGECADARINQMVSGIRDLKGDERVDVVLKLAQGATALVEEYCGQKRFDDAMKIHEVLSGLREKYIADPRMAYQFVRASARLCDALARNDRMEEAARFWQDLVALSSRFSGTNRDIAEEEAWATQNLSYCYSEYKDKDEKILNDVERVREMIFLRLASSDANRSVALRWARAARNLLIFYCGLERPEEAAGLYRMLFDFCRTRDREFVLEALKACANMTWFYGTKGRPLDATPIFTDSVLLGSLVKSDAEVGEHQLWSTQNLLLGYENAKNLKPDDIGPAYTAYGFIVSLRAAFDQPIFADAERQALYRLVVANCGVGNLSKAQTLFRQFVKLYADENDRQISRYEAAGAAKLLTLMAQKNFSDSERGAADEVYALVQPLRIAHIDDAEIALQEARAAHGMLKLFGRAQEIEQSLNYYYRVAALEDFFSDDRSLATERVCSAISMYEIYGSSSRTIESLEFSRVMQIYADIVALRSRFADDAEIAHLQAKAAWLLCRLCRGADGAVVGDEPEKLTGDLDSLYRAFPVDFFNRLMM